MRNVLLSLAVAFAFVSCHTKEKYTEQELVGLWVEPIPEMNKVQGVALKEGGEAHSINMATLLYEHWDCSGNELFLTGKSVGNHQTIAFTDTLKIEKVSTDSLILMRGHTRIAYRKSIEECGFSASPRIILHGTVTIAPEVHTFRPDGTTTDYWIIDKSGYLQVKYKEAQVPEWKVEAELELKEITTTTAEFAKHYAGAYEVMRVISLDESK